MGVRKRVERGGWRVERRGRRFTLHPPRSIQPLLPPTARIGYTMRPAAVRAADLPWTGPRMRTTLGALLLAAAVLGCENATPPPPAAPTTAPQPEAPDASLPIPHPGTLTGRVTWHGPVPQLPPLRVVRPEPGGSFRVLTRPAPNLPAVD